MRHSSGQRLVLTAVFLASIGCLQPAIDPVFLTLLTSTGVVSSAFHGWIVSATQTGMALGALAVWRLGSHVPHFGFVAAAALAAIASLATPHITSLAALLLVRGLYGAAMGMLYTQAMANAAANRPNGAYGAVFLVQLLLATGIAIALPSIAEATGPVIALSALALAPITALFLVSRRSQKAVRLQEHSLHDGSEHARTGVKAWATALSGFFFICSTMMIWSFAGAMAVDAGIAEETIGEAVALGSLAGAFTAMAVMRERPMVPPPIAGLLAGLGLLSPAIVTPSGDPMAFIASIVALNIGCTAIIVRTSGLASAASNDSLFRRFVACTHALGMIMGPLIGSLASATFGDAGLMGAAIATIATACMLMLVGQAHTLRLRLPARRQEWMHRA